MSIEERDGESESERERKRERGEYANVTIADNEVAPTLQIWIS